MTKKLVKLPVLWLIQGKDFLDKNKFHKIQNQPIPVVKKPFGGLWCSPFKYKGKYYSDWDRFCSEVNGYVKDMKKGIIIELKKETRFYIIDSQQDLIDLIKEMGEKEEKNKDLEIFNLLPMFDMNIDFEKLRKEYDVIYLTKEGMLETYLPMLNFRYNLYGWDCESALILDYNCVKYWKNVKLTNRK